MTATFPTQTKRVFDPETSDLDSLAIFAAQLLAESGDSVEQSTIAESLGLPTAVIDHRWAFLEPQLRAFSLVAQ